MRLLIVEDESEFAAILARGLERRGYAVDLAGCGAAALSVFEANEYDLVILDLNLPEMDGLDLLRHLRRTRPQVLILLLTARRRPEERVAGLDAGADDYLCKPFYFKELLARIRALLRRDLRVREPLLTRGELKLDVAAHRAWRGNAVLDLTRKEFAILDYLMRHPGEVTSQEELIEHIWNAQMNPFTNVVRVHIRSLRHKIGDDSRNPPWIQTVVGKGYRLAPEAAGEPT